MSKLPYQLWTKAQVVGGDEVEFHSVAFSPERPVDRIAVEVSVIAGLNLLTDDRIINLPAGLGQADRRIMKKCDHLTAELFRLGNARFQSADLTGKHLLILVL